MYLGKHKGSVASTSYILLTNEQYSYGAAGRKTHILICQGKMYRGTAKIALAFE